MLAVSYIYIKRMFFTLLNPRLPSHPQKRVCHIKSGLNFKWPILKMALLPTPPNFPQKYGMQIDRQQPLKNFNPLMALVFSQLVKKVLCSKIKATPYPVTMVFFSGAWTEINTIVIIKVDPFFFADMFTHLINLHAPKTSAQTRTNVPDSAQLITHTHPSVNETLDNNKNKEKMGLRKHWINGSPFLFDNLKPFQVV